MTPPDDFDRLNDQVREAAAYWFAAMRSADAEQRRAAFEAWRAEAPEHAAAYNQLIARWEQTAFVGSTSIGRQRRLSRAPVYERHPLASSLLALSALLLAGGAIVHAVSRDATAIETQTAETHLATSVESPPTAGKIVPLQDGSVVTLDRDSRLRILFSDTQRSLELVRGRARFEVAHAATPFIVTAGGTAIIAHGTMFDVALADRRARVLLLRGSVEVRAPAGRTASRYLKPGEQVSVATDGSLSRPGPAAAVSDWVAEMVAFEDARLADAVRRMNDGASPSLFFDPSLGNLRLTGAFRAGDTRGFAQAIATMFNLRLDDRGAAGLMLLPAIKRDRPGKNGG